MPRVLLADDEAGALRLLLATLPDDYEKTVAFDGLTAIKKAEEVRPDLIILDLAMPGMDGFQVLQRIRQSLRLGRSKVVVVSALSGEDDRDRALGLGADAYLVKPFSPVALLETVTRLLEESSGN